MSNDEQVRLVFEQEITEETEERNGDSLRWWGGFLFPFVQRNEGMSE